jgi:hypothetical protein
MREKYLNVMKVLKLDNNKKHLKVSSSSDTKEWIGWMDKL